MPNTLKRVSVENFIEKLKTDKELQQKLKESAENVEEKSRETAEKTMIAIAEEAGFRFTANELREYEAKLAANKDGAELSTDELKKVAGGVSCIICGMDRDSDEGGLTNGNCVLFGSQNDTYCVLIGKD